MDFVEAKHKVDRELICQAHHMDHLLIGYLNIFLSRPLYGREDEMMDILSCHVLYDLS